MIDFIVSVEEKLKAMNWIVVNLGKSDMLYQLPSFLF